MIVRTREAVHLFEPVDAQTPDLVDVIPSYFALFSFRPNNGKQIRLQIETSPVFGVDDVHEVTHRKWSETNLEIGPPLQIFNIRPQGLVKPLQLSNLYRSPLWERSANVTSVV